LKAVGAEFVGMFLFITIGCGCYTANGAADVQARISLAFAFGMAAMIIGYAIGHHSGAHLNCAVTFSLVLGKHVTWYQGLANTVAQFIGSMLGAGLLAIIYPCNKDISGNLGSNVIQPNFQILRVLVCEAFGTYLLCFTVWQTAVTPQAQVGKNAFLAIGFAVFVAHVLFIPVDGCSINPIRSTGPALVSAIRNCDNLVEGGLQDLWIMWIGPLLGAAAATGVQVVFAPNREDLKKLEDIAEEFIKADKTLEDAAEEKETDAVGPEDIKLEDCETMKSQINDSKQGLTSRIVGKCMPIF
jgi:MIP family channel proteins